MINNTSFQKWSRIAAKSIDSQFIHEMEQGLNCSPFETQIMVEKVHELYGPLFETSVSIKPGQIQTIVMDITTGPGTPLKKGKQRMVTVSLHSLEEDIKIRQKEGVPALRQKRLIRICEEAFQQGGLFTLEDLSILFNCGLRTLVLDLEILRKEKIVPPLRSTVKDIGRAISHRNLIVSLWLEGKEYSEIVHKTHHSITSVASYIEKFKRCIALSQNGFDHPTIAFLARMSLPFVQQYLKIHQEGKACRPRKLELESFLKKNFFQEKRE